MTDIQQFAHRYVAVWNEGNPDVRRAIIEELWAPDGVEFTQTQEHRGHDGLEKRVVSAYDDLVADQDYRFHLDGPAYGHHGMVAFRTTMTPAAGGEVAWIGLMVIHLDDAGRIREDHQFTVG